MSLLFTLFVIAVVIFAMTAVLSVVFTKANATTQGKDTRMPIYYKKFDDQAELRCAYDSPGIDLLCLDVSLVEQPNQPFPAFIFKLKFKLGFEIPVGYVGILKDRSGGCLLFQHVAGVIDPDYRGEVSALVYAYPSPYDARDDNQGLLDYLRSTLIGTFTTQMLIVPAVVANLTPVDQLSPTKRQSAGFGSSGS